MCTAMQVEEFGNVYGNAVMVEEFGGVYGNAGRGVRWCVRQCR